MDGIVKNSAGYLSISDIVNVTQLTAYEVREALQKVVDIYNSIMKMGNETYEPKIIETFFNLKEFKHNRNKEDIAINLGLKNLIININIRNGVVYYVRKYRNSFNYHRRNKCYGSNSSWFYKNND